MIFALEPETIPKGDKEDESEEDVKDDEEPVEGEEPEEGEVKKGNSAKRNWKYVAEIGTSETNESEIRHSI